MNLKLDAFPVAKQPGSSAWYLIPFHETLTGVVSADTLLASSDALSSPDSLAVSAQALSADKTGALVLLAGGLAGASYIVRATATGADGSTLVRDVLLRVAGPTVDLGECNVCKLPALPGEAWDDLAWPSKDPADVLDYALDCADYLARTGQEMLSASVTHSTSTITCGAVRYGLTGGQKTSVALQISGGTAGTTPRVALGLTLSNSRVLNVIVALPIRLGWTS